MTEVPLRTFAPFCFIGENDQRTYGPAGQQKRFITKRMTDPLRKEFLGTFGHEDGRPDSKRQKSYVILHHYL